MPRPMVGILACNINGQGWNEKYFFKASVNTYDAALPILQQIAYGRTAFFGVGAEIIYARVSQVGPAPDKRTCVLPYPLGPHPSWLGGIGIGDTLAQINDPRTSVQMTAESAEGRWGNRYYRCMPDTWVIGNALVESVKPYYQQTASGVPDGDMGPTGGLSHLSVCQSFWSYLKANTVLSKKVTSIDYTLTDIQVFVMEQVTSKKLGKRFRLSAGKRPAA